jgi:hypothetical protein
LEVRDLYMDCSFATIRKRKSREAESTKAANRGGLSRSSEEVG